MPSRFSLRFAVGLFLLIPCPAQAQRARDAGPLPNDPDKLVALLAGEHLPLAATKRAGPGGRGWRAAVALMNMKDDAIPALARGLDSRDRLIRINAVFVLRRIGTPATLPLRIKGASDPDAGVREQAVAGLPAYRSDEARRTLLKALEDPDPAVRNAAIRELQPRDERPDNQVRSSTASALIPLLDDPATQYAAAQVLGQLGMDIAARPLLRLLKAEDKFVRSVAAIALGQLKDKPVAMELTAALRDPEAYVRGQAAGALGPIGDLRTTPALVGLLSDAESFVRGQAAGALGQVGDLRAVPSLLPLLDDPDERVRAAAAEALGRIGDVRAVEPLCRSLVPKDRDRSSMARALGRLRDPRAIKPLRDFLLALEPCPDPDGIREGVDALAQIRHPDSVEALVRVALDTHDGLVSSLARRSLDEITGASLSYKGKDVVARWWDMNREDYLRPIPEK